MGSSRKLDLDYGVRAGKDTGVPKKKKAPVKPGQSTEQENYMG